MRNSILSPVPLRFSGRRRGTSTRFPVFAAVLAALILMLPATTQADGGFVEYVEDAAEV